MLFILVALALIFPNVADQEDSNRSELDRLADHLLTKGLEGLKMLITETNGKLKWREGLANRTLKWLRKNPFPKVYLTIKGERCISKMGDGWPDDDFLKKASDFAAPFEKRKKFITDLGAGGFGCNGFVNGTGEVRRCIYVGCSFNKKRKR
uniref:SCP domain-containing protein n=1 Tax=Haemonchus contortus TaxID=6289 RepID=A0A7I4YYW3_HAECO